MRPESSPARGFRDAMSVIAGRIASSLGNVAPEVLPVRMYVAGGAALHLHTGERVSNDVDAAFSHRLALPEDLEVVWRDTDGSSRLLYLDRNYNDTFALLHEEAYDDSLPLSLPGVDPHVLDVRLLSPLDLAVSKLGRFSEQDREDILALARLDLIEAAALRRRAEEALGGYVGAIARLRTTIDIACRMIATRPPQL